MTSSADCRFKLSYDDEARLKEGNITHLPGHASLYENFGGRANFDGFLAMFELWTAQGLADLPDAKGLNRGLTGVQAMSVRSMLEMYWKGGS